MDSVDQSPTISLDLDGIAKFINSGKCKNIAFLTGAGVSVGAGIPDFRSPGGMYDTLRPELLTASPGERALMSLDPTAVVSWRVFGQNQLPYLELRRPFILGLAEGKWKATISHFFVRLCHDKGLLRRLYTQNIDGLDFQTQVPQEKIVPVHGSMGKIGCENCGVDYPTEEFRKEVQSKIKDIYGTDVNAPKESTVIPCLQCQKTVVKPRTVLYGRNLPPAFFECSENDFPGNVDLLVVAGTSLTVGPANSVVRLVSDTCLRFTVNRDPVGAGLGIVYGPKATRDIFFAEGNATKHFWR